VFAGLDMGPYEESYHGCTFGAAIDDPHELATLFRRVAADRIKAQW